MNKSTKLEIENTLGKLRDALGVLKKKNEDLNAAEAAVEKFEREITRLGEPDYQDDAAITRLATLKQKSDLCRKAIQRMRGELPQAIANLVEVISTSGMVAANCLSEIRDNRFATVVSSLLPFSSTLKAAEDLARNSDACLAAEFALANYRGLAGPIRTSPFPAHCIEAALKIEAVLVEATSKTPDLLQFLPFQAAEAKK